MLPGGQLFALIRIGILYCTEISTLPIEGEAELLGSATNYPALRDLQFVPQMNTIRFIF